MKGLVGFGFFLLSFAYMAFTITISYVCFTIAWWLGIVAIVVMLGLCIIIVVKIKRKFEYYKGLAEQSERNIDQPTEQE